MDRSSTQRATRPAAATAKLTYRGVRLQAPAGRSRFPIAQIRKAVEDALAKNAASLSRPE